MAEHKTPTLVSDIRETKEVNGVTWVKSKDDTYGITFHGMWFPCEKKLSHGYIKFQSEAGPAQDDLMEAFMDYLKKEKTEIRTICRKRLHLLSCDHSRFNWYGCQQFVYRFSSMEHLIMACEDTDFEKCMPTVEDWIYNDDDPFNVGPDEIHDIEQPELKLVLGALREFVLANKDLVLKLESEA